MKAANGCLIWIGFLAIVVGGIYFWVRSVDVSAYDKAVKLSNSKKYPKEQMGPIKAYLLERPNGARKAEAERLLEKLEQKLEDSSEQTNTLAVALKAIKHNFTPQNRDALRETLDECPLAMNTDEAEELLAKFDEDFILVVDPQYRRPVTVEIIPNTAATRELAGELKKHCRNRYNTINSNFRRIKEVTRLLKAFLGHSIGKKEINGEESFKLVPKGYFIIACYPHIKHDEPAESWWILKSSPIRDQRITLSTKVSHEKYNRRLGMGFRKSLYVGF